MASPARQPRRDQNDQQHPLHDEHVPTTTGSIPTITGAIPVMEDEAGPRRACDHTIGDRPTRAPAPPAIFRASPTTSA